MTDFTLAAVILMLMGCLAATVIWTFWKLLHRDELPSIEESRSIGLGMLLGLIFGVFIGIPLGWIVLDNAALGLSLGAGGGLSLGLGIVNLPLIRGGDRN
jgi:hypothetical protein